MKVESFFDKNTFTVTYVVYDEQSKDAVVIDSVLDFDSHSGTITNESYLKVKNYILDNGLKLKKVLETHAHADHLTAAPLFKKDFPEAALVIGKAITLVQQTFAPVFNLVDLDTDGSQFDILMDEGDVLEAGTIKIEAISTPGHTPACLTYKIDNMIFTGDAIFMPDMGTGRCDFPKGSAEDLYNSIQKLYKLSDDTIVYVGHDYAPNGREYNWQTTIGELKANNIQLKASTSKEEFIDFRNKRDATLAAPKLLLPSIQVNIDAGHLPKSESNDKQYLKIPLNLKF
ncbi:MBL fold metallo-hydrolase [Bacteriovorax sp. Seq25_V]|uniref:MBL fold metallo-hydrolase n=1 Tax=Bacteriovorax sp. Seq25_V TaxID=1201288 RepID=UPI000389F487|nr:MBL fold metallo-hydrolase [Bacteriovorax sp. Seq25_V]EQC44050.1 metallo-beta-lactamase domain protein [Bacteriovorax sp. Seq25_V]